VDDDLSVPGETEQAVEQVRTPIFTMEATVVKHGYLRQPFRKSVEGSQSMQETGDEIVIGDASELTERTVDLSSQAAQLQAPEHRQATVGDTGVTATAPSPAPGAGHGDSTDMSCADGILISSRPAVLPENVIPFRPRRDFKSELMQFDLLWEEDFEFHFEAWFDELTQPLPDMKPKPMLRLVESLPSALVQPVEAAVDGCTQAPPVTEAFEETCEKSTEFGTTDMIAVTITSAALPEEYSPKRIDWIDAKATHCDESGEATRRVKLAWPDGRSFNGYVVMQSQNTWHAYGYGVLSWDDGRRYEGEFAQGLPQGEGLLVHPEYGRFEGRFVNGKPVMRGVQSIQ
jgi:hypothetical protein